MNLSVIGQKQVRQTLEKSHEKVIELIKKTYLQHEDGITSNPNSYFLRFPDQPNNRIIALPARIKECGESLKDVAGIKWISSFPSNINNAIPRASALLLLNNMDTGFPYACLEGSEISAARTAASAVLAAYYLNDEEKTIDTLSIIGTGFISETILNYFIGSGWKITNLVLFDIHTARAKSFADKAQKLNPDLNLSISVNVEVAMNEASMIVFATIASMPFILDKNKIPNSAKILHISLRDLSPEIILEANNVVDDVNHVLNAGTSVHLASQSSGSTDFILGTLAQIIRGEVKFNPVKPRIFSPFGLGILDLALGQYVYEKLQNQKETTLIPNFFEY